MRRSLHFLLLDKLKEIKKKILEGKEFLSNRKVKSLRLGMLISENLLLLEFIIDLYSRKPEISQKEAKLIKRELLEIKEIFSDLKKGLKIKLILEKIEKVLPLLE